MSVDKIAPLTQMPLDALAARTNGAAQPHAAAQPSAPAPVAPAATPAAFFDSIALPLPESPQSAPPPAPGASYTRLAASDLAQLVDGRLTPAALTREVEALLRQLSNTRETSVARLIESVALAPRARLPSRNLDDALWSFQSRLTARETGSEEKKLDLYLTRIGARQWEAAVYRHDDTTPAPPYPAAPLQVERLVIDPSTGHILACVATQLAPRAFALEEQAETLVRGLRLSLLIVAIAAATIILAHKFSMVVALAFGVTAAAFFLATPDR